MFSTFPPHFRSEKVLVDRGELINPRLIGLSQLLKPLLQELFLLVAELGLLRFSHVFGHDRFYELRGDFKVLEIDENNKNKIL